MSASELFFIHLNSASLLPCLWISLGVSEFILLSLLHELELDSIGGGKQDKFKGLKQDRSSNVRKVGGGGSPKTGCSVNTSVPPHGPGSLLRIQPSYLH